MPLLSWLDHTKILKPYELPKIQTIQPHAPNWAKILKLTFHKKQNHSNGSKIVPKSNQKQTMVPWLATYSLLGHKTKTKNQILTP